MTFYIKINQVPKKITESNCFGKKIDTRFFILILLCFYIVFTVLVKYTVIHYKLMFILLSSIVSFTT